MARLHPVVGDVLNLPGLRLRLPLVINPRGLVISPRGRLVLNLLGGQEARRRVSKRNPRRIRKDLPPHNSAREASAVPQTRIKESKKNIRNIWNDLKCKLA